MPRNLLWEMRLRSETSYPVATRASLSVLFTTPSNAWHRAVAETAALARRTVLGCHAALGVEFADRRGSRLYARSIGWLCHGGGTTDCADNSMKMCERLSPRAIRGYVLAVARLARGARRVRQQGHATTT